MTERPSSTEAMLSSIPSITLPAIESSKERCPVDKYTEFYYLEEGISYRCPRCKQLRVVKWEEILQHYQEVCKKQGLSSCKS